MWRLPVKTALSAVFLPAGPQPEAAPVERLTLAERARIAALAFDRTRRSAISRLLSSPLLRWRYGGTGQLLIVPQCLRTADPSLWQELRLGELGLAGAVAYLDGGSPFDANPPNAAWSRALHGFDWLRHLEASGLDEARNEARSLVTEWAIRHRGNGSGVAWEPAVVARRLISWLSHANFLLENADPATFGIVSESLAVQLARLSGEWRDAPAGYPRLLALTALLLADLCVAGHDRQLGWTERAFAGELERQILPDGGHISRNPAILVEVMLDLLPLRQCFVARGRKPPEAMTDAMRRIIPMLRYLRLGDGMLARFNGAGVPSPASLATVLAYDDPGALLPQGVPASGYLRMERGRSIVIMDVGPPPPVEFAGEAHAGCLSFEMSIGSRLLFVNGGTPGPADVDWRAAARATASHNTLCLAETSSSRLVRNRQLEALLGAKPIRLPAEVCAVVKEKDKGLMVFAHHDGYLERFRLLHRRWLLLYASGERLEGVDHLGPPNRRLRLKQDLPFAIHFHLHPEAACKPLDAHSAEIALGGEAWRFSAQGAALLVEESIYFAEAAGPRRSLQIVLRGATFGETEVRWTLERSGGEAEQKGNGQVHGHE